MKLNTLSNLADYLNINAWRINDNIRSFKFDLHQLEQQLDLSIPWIQDYLFPMYIGNNVRVPFIRDKKDYWCITNNELIIEKLKQMRLVELPTYSYSTYKFNNNSEAIAFKIGNNPNLFKIIYG